MIEFGGGDYPDIKGATWALSWGTPIKPFVSCVPAQGWTAGAPLDIPLVLGNPLAGPRPISWRVTSERNWPGASLDGVALVNGTASDTVHVRIDAPDTAAIGSNHLRIAAVYSGAEGNDTTFVCLISDATTGTLASLVSAEAQPDGVRLVWQTSGDAAVSIQRRRAETAWAEVGVIRPERGRVVFEDRDVQPGERYGYRLAWNDSRGVVVAGEVWIDVPTAAKLALLGFRPNPAAGDLTVSFSLPAEGPVVLDLYDVAGRRVSEDRTTAMPAGNHLLSIRHGERLVPGIYIIGLTYGDRMLRARGVVVR
jgi:hypothetical protein